MESLETNHSLFYISFPCFFALHLEHRPHKSFTITLSLMDWECQTLRMFASKWKFHIENNELVTLFVCAWLAWPLRIYEWRKTSFFWTVGKTSELISSFIFRCTRHELNDQRAHYHVWRKKWNVLFMCRSKYWLLLGH